MDNEELISQIVASFDSVSRVMDAQERFDQVVQEEVAQVWQDVAALRDDVHALANRVENLTRALMAEPGDVADAIVRHAAGRVFDQEGDDAAA